MDTLTFSYLDTLYQGQDLTQAQCQALFDQVIKGKLDDIVISSMLTALKIKGESPAEIAGAAAALINNAAPFPRPDYAFADIVGTGGDGHNTINISSAAAIVAASCGVKVAKHGNRSVSSKSGSADLFRTFGMDLTMSAATARQCLDETGLCFLFAPNYHAGIKHAMPVRTTLKTRTLFNLLGPLANPAKPSHMMIGVYAPELVRPFAETLKLLGYQHAMVVHGSGLDELALHGPSKVAELQGSEIHEYQVTPEDFGLKPYSLDSIKGGEPEENKALIENVLRGQGDIAHQSAVAINTAALLKLTGIAADFTEGTAIALAAMNGGQAYQTILAAAKTSQRGTH
ncbi:anthranilate phosphoribosyltransferase [Aliiglaciecola litoralis]|uniref:Anthranilate phosphoribosyltransferase n=1 Tax=Aliiglaciecola litoralis TaxID=582857 RepID=A0ABN1LD71_9ALTE